MYLRIICSSRTHQEKMKQKKQIKLRDWIEEDLDEYEFWHTGRKKWMEYDAPYYKKPTKIEIQNKLNELRKSIISKSWENPRKRLVIADVKNNKFIGTVSWYWQSKETNWKSIGIAIYDEKFWGMGIGSDSLKLWINYLFDKCKDIVRLDLRTWSGNQKMINLSKKMGFKEEARFRMARIVNGNYYDSIGMGLLRSEWEGIAF